MAGPVVTLEFAGDSAKLERAFDGVGEAASKMSREVASTSSALDSVGSGIDGTGQKAGDLESGFRGVTDTMSGFAAIAQGDVLGGLTDLAGGAEALAVGFSGVLIPALKNAGSWLAQTRVGTLAIAAAQRVAAAATVVWTAVQRVLNMVMRANPIGLVITVIMLLVGAVILAWKRSETFRRIVTGAWNAVKAGAVAMWNGIRAAWNSVTNFVGNAVRRIGGFLSGMWNGITTGLRAALNWAIGLINQAINGINFLIRGANNIPGVNISQVSPIPVLHDGGIVPGSPGSETLALLQAGERVTPAGQVAREPRTVRVDLGPALMKMIRQQVRDEGGNVQIVLGSA